MTQSGHWMEHSIPSNCVNSTLFTVTKVWQSHSARRWTLQKSCLFKLTNGKVKTHTQVQNQSRWDEQCGVHTVDIRFQASALMRVELHTQREPSKGNRWKRIEWPVQWADRKFTAINLDHEGRLYLCLHYIAALLCIVTAEESKWRVNKQRALIRTCPSSCWSEYSFLGTGDARRM